MRLKLKTDPDNGVTTVAFTDAQRKKLADIKTMFKQIMIADDGPAGFHAAYACGAIENILTGAPIDPGEDVPDGEEGTDGI